MTDLEHGKIFRPTQQAMFLIASFAEVIPTIFMRRKRRPRHPDALVSMSLYQHGNIETVHTEVTWRWRGARRMWCGKARAK